METTGTRAASALGAFLVGSVLLATAYQVTPGISLSGGTDVVTLTPLVILVVAIGLARVARLRTYGWFVSAAGLLGLALLYLQGSALDGQLLFLAAALCVGLLLAGALTALQAASATTRWVILVGLATGLLAGRSLMGFVVEAVRTAVFDGDGHADDLVFAVLALLTGVAGLVVARVPVAPATTPPGRSVLVPVAGIALGANLLEYGWQRVLDQIAQSATGGFSQQQAEQIDQWTTAFHLAVTVLLGVVLVMFGYRRGGPSLARWVLVAFAIGVLGERLAPERPLFLLPGLVMTVAAVAGTLLGAAAVRRIDRLAPWDALAVAATTALVAAATDVLHTAWISTGLVLFAAGLGLAAGLARLQVIGPDQLAGSTALGFAALILGQQAAQPVVRTGVGIDDIRPAVVFVTGAAAVGLIVLFVLGRRPQASVPEPAVDEGAPAE